mmetsp:Transcript_25311/g.70785  ORF Transcript_25311/g.70785 Transcript_25311/m.70785 type:complete len:126 (+) Transcript_25311:782-1159(+)
MTYIKAANTRQRRLGGSMFGLSSSRPIASGSFALATVLHGAEGCRLLLLLAVDSFSAETPGVSIADRELPRLGRHAAGTGLPPATLCRADPALAQRDSPAFPTVMDISVLQDWHGRSLRPPSTGS